MLQFLKAMSDEVKEATKDLPQLKKNVKAIQSKSKRIENYNPSASKINIKSNMLAHADDSDEELDKNASQTIGPKSPRTSTSEVQENLSDVDANLERLTEMQESLKKVSE